MKMIKLIVVFVLLITVSNVSAMNNCEELARDYQDIHGGSLIFIQPLTASGSYDLGRYNGHWINCVYMPSLFKRHIH